MKRFFGFVITAVILAGCSGNWSGSSALPGLGTAAELSHVDSSSVQIAHQGASRALSLRVFAKGSWRQVLIKTTVRDTMTEKDIVIAGTVEGRSFAAYFKQNKALNETVITYSGKNGGMITEAHHGLVGTPSGDAQLLADVAAFKPDEKSAGRHAMFASNAGQCAAMCAVFLLAASPELWAVCYGTCLIAE